MGAPVRLQQRCPLPLHLWPPQLRLHRQLLLQALRLLQDLRLLQLQALLLWPLRLQGILLSGELTLDGLPRISTTTNTKKHREEPLSEETLHKTKLTDNKRRRTKKEKPYLKFKQQC